MKYVAPLGILALIVAGFAYYTLFAGPNLDSVEMPVRSAAEMETEPQSEPAERESFSGAGSLYDLLTRGDNLECSITYIPNPVEPEITGGLFVYNGDVRGDFVVPTPDLSGQMVTSIIIADGTIWQWTDIDGEMVGSRQAADYSPATLARLVAPVGFTTETQYNCLSWAAVDYTIFEPPTGVSFTDAENATFEEGVIYEAEGEF